MRAEPSIASSSRLIRVLGLASIVLAAACGSDSPTEPVPANEVRVQNNSFSPALRTVAAGTMVTFRWSASANTHNVTFADGPASPSQSSGTFTRTFAVAGSFAYQCTIHSGMNGTITVQ